VKRRIIPLLCLLLCCLLPFAAMAEKILVVSHGNAVNVRKGPGSAYGAYGEAQPGRTYPYAGSEDGWNCIWVSSTEKGYLSSKYTTVREVSTEEFRAVEMMMEPYIWLVVTNPNPVNVRSGPHKSFASVGHVQRNESYLYHGTENGWHCITLDDGTRGYIANNMAAVVADDDSRAPLRTLHCGDCRTTGKCSYCNGRGYIGEKDCFSCYGLAICALCYGHGYR